MKKCPYCAEEIQEEAIKCKHCGEWLPGPTEDTRSDKSETSREEHMEKDKIDSVEKNIEPTTPRTADSTQHDETPGVKPLANKTGKKESLFNPRLTWGAVVFLVILGYGSTKNNIFTNYTLSLIWFILIFLFLIPYYALRRRFLKNWKFPGAKPWKAGLASGVCIYLLALMVFGVMLFLDKRSLNKTIAQLDEKYNTKVTAFKQEENQFTSRFIEEPKTQEDIEQNVQIIDEAMTYNKRKHEFIHEMFNEYKQVLGNKKVRNGKKSWNDSIDQILGVYDKHIETQQKAWLLLKKHYISGEETYYQEYTTTLQAASQLGAEFKKMVMETFGHS